MHNADLQQRNMRLLYSLLGLTGVLAIGGLTLNLTRRRWLAEETSRMKSAFMARLSHDMCTPLTAILGMSELLQQKGAPEKERKNALRYLTQAGGALLEMVRDVTDHASLEQGALQLRAAPFSLRAALDDCIVLFLPVAEAKGLDIDLDVDPQLPDAVVGDSFRLRQALGNLVSNAVKFTELGRVCASAWGPPGENRQVLLLARRMPCVSGFWCRIQGRVCPLKTPSASLKVFSGAATRCRLPARGLDCISRAPLPAAWAAM